jgi:asparagine synthetase B (glutamine-hydrolysing)
MQLKADFLPANTTTIFNLETGEQVRSFPVFNFDVSNQHKTTYDGWTAAFKASITKRSSGQGGNIFVGLSGGYDSGTIVTELLEQKIIFDSYSMYGSENKAVLDARMAQMNNQQLLEISQHQYKTIQNHLLEICEPIYDPTLKKDLRTGKGSVGIYTLCDAANRNGKKIHLSGQGADEIMSDYGIKGKKVGAGTTKSDLAGVFPNDLTKVFPWTNFYKGNQEAFIAINEHVGGAFGIETRYPFLDPALVQEFLWLTPSLKNQEYKAPLQHYLELHNFPYTKEEKTGFSANKSLRG